MCATKAKGAAREPFSCMPARGRRGDDQARRRRSPATIGAAATKLIVKSLPSISLGVGPSALKQRQSTASSSDGARACAGTCGSASASAMYSSTGTCSARRVPSNSPV